MQIGLTPIYFKEGDFIEVQLAVYDEVAEELKPENVLDGTMRLYRNSTELTNIKFNRSQACDDGYLKVYFNHPLDITDLSVQASTILLDGSNLSATKDVITESGEDRKIPTTTNPTRIEQRSAPNIVGDFASSQETPFESENYDEPIIDETNPIGLKYDATSEFEYLDTGYGSVAYAGGGNRLLDTFADDFIIQDVNEFYNDISAKPLIEIAATNLQLNSVLALAPGATIPTGFVFSTTKPSIIVTPTSSIVYASFMYNAFRLQATEPYDGTTVKATFGYGSKIAVDSTKPIMVSVLTKVVKNDALSTINTIDFTVRFYTAGDVLLDTVVQSFDVTTLSEDYNTLEHYTDIGDIPAGTAKIEWDLSMYSIEGADDVTWYLACPQVEQVEYASSRIPTTTATKTRLADVLSLPQPNNIRLALGQIEFTFTPLLKSSASQMYLFDTRSDTGTNGFAVYRRSDAKFVLAVANATGLSFELVSAATLFGAGENTIRLSWTTTALNVYLNSVNIISQSAAYSGPADVPDYVKVGSRYDGTLQLPNIPTSLEIRRFQTTP